MAAEKIEVLDPIRVFWGELPWSFGFEIILRSSLMFIFLLIILRLSGKRSLSQMSPFEFSLLIALGSAVGDPMFYENVPILHAFIVITVVIGLLNFLEKITSNNKFLEKLLEGEAISLVDKGTVVISNTNNEKISSEEVFTKLREQGIKNLGAVENSYLEVSGMVSIFTYGIGEKKQGLNILPLRKVAKYSSGEKINGYYSCLRCGLTKEYENSILENCINCNNKIWVEAEETIIQK